MKHLSLRSVFIGLGFCLMFIGAALTSTSVVEIRVDQQESQMQVLKSTDYYAGKKIAPADLERNDG